MERRRWHGRGTARSSARSDFLVPGGGRADAGRAGSAGVAGADVARGSTHGIAAQRAERVYPAGGADGCGVGFADDSRSRRVVTAGGGFWTGLAVVNCSCAYA